MSIVDQAVSILRESLGREILAVESFRGDTIVTVERTSIVAACRTLRDHKDLHFNLLVALTAVDYWPAEPRFAVVYQLYSIARNASLRLRVNVPGESPQVPTVEEVYPNANWHEREVYDMFGILFTGHSDLRRILMPHDWVGHPLRKDHPLGYEEVQFSFNYEEIDRKKPRAEE